MIYVYGTVDTSLCDLSDFIFSQGFTNQVGQRGLVSNGRYRCRSPKVSQHSKVEEHNEVVLSIRHAEVSNLG